jgi:pyrroline-5-carboxylate reductase
VKKKGECMNKTRIAILGAGNIGMSIAKGLVTVGGCPAQNIILTRRKIQSLEAMKKQGFIVEQDNKKAVKDSKIIIIAVEPLQINKLLTETALQLEAKKHIIISVVTGVSIEQIGRQIRKKIAIVRAMPNMAIAIGESMTCLASNGNNTQALTVAKAIFETVGKVLIINEEQMIAATVLGACGIAFFLRAIRAASQGGIEIGFHPQDALFIAAQTAKGAAELLLKRGSHPEDEIDKVTTPRGCTIAGLNQMEHEGFSSAMIKGITVSTKKAATLYSEISKR